MKIEQLFELACQRLTDRLSDLEGRGEPFDRYVWAFFDVTQQPGRYVAIAGFQNQGKTRDEAAEQVDALVKQQAAKTGGVFTMGMLQPKPDFSAFIQSITPPGATNPLLDWLKKSPPTKSHFAVVAIAGKDTRASFVDYSKVPDKTSN